jgi:protein phosphatase
MENSVATIQCSNPSCQAPNPLSNKFCHKCRTPIVRRYLWAVGDWLKAYRIGELIGDRYLLKKPRIVLDTQPGIPPLTPEEVPDRITPYLKLLPYRLHVPQVYGYLPSPDDQLDLEIWFLEYGNIPTEESGELKYEELLPKLSEVWQKATAMRQLNWLCQIAHLWQPLQSKGVVSSLLNPSLLTVNGAIIQLLELQFDESEEINLPQLGQLWSQWIPQASPTLTEFLQQLCQHLEQGTIERSQQLISILESGIEQNARLQEQTYQIYTYTDSGPTRDHNEDACYPPSGEPITISAQEKALAIVCDGIGGQEGGEIASQLAIDTMLAEVNKLSLAQSESNPHLYTQAIEQAICATNDLISERNDRENRQERQRMGTTLVMSLARAHEIYVAHVGDSRIYWITPTSCHQVTVDDDLASREVRLGYLLYREAIQYPNAGALVQALGMSASPSLHPTVQRFILDEDCVFLLCSDGLSDFDRVEQYWESEIVPILRGETEVKEVGKRLLEIANRKNGHDNVTIALVYCQVKPKTAVEASSLVYPALETPEPMLPTPEEIEEGEETVLQVPKESIDSPEQPTPRRTPSLLLLLLVVSVLLGLGGACYWVWQQMNSENDDILVPMNSPDDPPVRPWITPPPPEPLAEGDIVKTLIPIKLQENKDLRDRVGEVPQESILKVLLKEPHSSWLQLQVCHIPPTEKGDRAVNLTVFSEGKAGWIQSETIEPTAFQKQAPALADPCNLLNEPSPSLSPSPSSKTQQSPK